MLKLRDSKLPYVFSILIAVIALVLLYFLIQSFFTQITVSKETTYITEPLAEDGLPDYEAYLLEKGFEGITHEDNAAVILWQVLWSEECDEPEYHLVLESLGINDVPKHEQCLMPMDHKKLRTRVAEWLCERYSKQTGREFPEEFQDKEEFLAGIRGEAVESAIDETWSRPWTSEQLPPMAQWATENQRQLDMLIEASKRPRYFSPSPTFLNGKCNGLIVALLPMVQAVRGGASALNARAMLNLGEERIEEAWQDILACYRLSRLTAQGWHLVHHLVAIEIDGMANDRTIALLHYGKLNPEQARQIMQELRELPELPKSTNILNTGERLACLDSIITIATGRDNGLIDEDIGWSKSIVDWDYVLREGNELYDQIVEVAAIDDRMLRKQRASELSEELEKRTQPKSNISLFISRQRRSELMADMMIGSMCPATESVFTAEDRAFVRRELVKTAAALAVYRAEHGEYPQQLSEMVPEVLPALPLDPFSDKPLIYEKKNDGGYLLYSVFINGRDDGGSDVQGEIVNGEWVEEPEYFWDQEKSDIVIRVPLPAFRLPEIPAAEED